jgi:hypothetical protein
MDLLCGDINAHDITAHHYGPSDQRLKDDIETIEDPLNLVRKVRGVSFKWREGPHEGEADFGVVAQELRKVLPQLVVDSRGTLGVAYMSLVPILIEGLKELAGEVDGLRKEVAALQKRTKKAKKHKDDKPGKAED